MTHLIQQVELRHVGDLRVKQLVCDVEDSLVDRQLDTETDDEFDRRNQVVLTHRGHEHRSNIWLFLTYLT